MNASPMCCGYVSSYVDNVPGKEYYYCRECKNEVLAEPNNELPYFVVYPHQPSFWKSTKDEVHER